MGCKSSLHALTNQFAGMKEKLKSVEKKVKDLEKKKSKKCPCSEELSTKVNKLMLKLAEKEEKK